MAEIITSDSPAAQTRSLASFESAAEMFQYATLYVQAHRQHELDDIWQTILIASQTDITEHLFLKEYLWCVYVSGFSAQTIAKKYKALLCAHFIEDENQQPVKIEPSNVLDEAGLRGVYEIFRNKSKARAVQKTRKLILTCSWQPFYEEWIKPREPEKLMMLPNIGPALSCHLARNLGNLNVVKPDVHLVRLAKKYDFESVADMCKHLSPTHPPGYTDLILWIASRDNGTT